MTSNNISKWFPKQAQQQNDKVFERTKSIERELKILANKFATNINFNLLDYYAFQMLLEQGKIYFQESCFSQYKLYRIGNPSTDKKVERSNYKVLLNRKALLIRTNLRRRHFQLMFIISKTIKRCLFNGIYEAAFHLCSLYNNIIILTSQHTKCSSGSLTVSNTYPSLLSNPKRMDISSILQLITKYRTESCCAGLISCLLANCRADLQYDDDDSDTSSIQVFRALTTQLSHTQESPPDELIATNIQHPHHPYQHYGINKHSQIVSNDSNSKKKETEIKFCSIVGKHQPATIEAIHAADDPAIDFFDRMANGGDGGGGDNDDDDDSERHKNVNDNSICNESGRRRPERMATIVDDNDDGGGGAAAVAAGRGGGFMEDEESQLLIELIRAEEIFIAHITAKCLKLTPTAFDGSIEEITKAEIMKLISKASRFLWTHVTSTLEHYVLWWNHAPLACRPIGCTVYLRTWLLTQCYDVPEPILSTLKSLGQVLTLHVIGCLWDKQFRNCLVLSSRKPDQTFDQSSEFFCPTEKLQGTTCGHFYSELLQSLVTITNSCDFEGTIAAEIPINEQIPVLHRLDHSIHTLRLWSLTTAKELLSNWNMKVFFRVVSIDMNLALEHLNDLRLPVLVSTNPSLDVHITVNVALREKLVSEVKINREKAKKTTSECVNNVFAAICEQTSLATLKIYFPTVKIWRVNHLKATHNQYIDVYLDIIYMPVIEATKDMEILSLALKIIGEALLEHIYAKRIKFSICGAINLMKDFEGIAAWIQQCNQLPETYRDKLSKHEVLKVCEGVGKILLRQPNEIISMFPSKQPKGEKGSATDDAAATTDDDTSALPPEMYIDQQKWLALRATRKSVISCLCNNVGIIS